MTLYGYQCRECGQEYTSTIRGNHLKTDLGLTVPCHECEAPVVKRKYSISTHRGMQEHMNKTTGTLISSERQFREELKRKSEAQYLKTGIPCDYQPMDPEEAKQVVIDSDAVGLESTNRVRVNEGRPPIRL